MEGLFADRPTQVEQQLADDVPWEPHVVVAAEPSANNGARGMLGPSAVEGAAK